MKLLTLLALFVTFSAQASPLIRIDSKNDFIKQIAVTGDESVYGVATDGKLYVSHNRGQEWTVVPTNFNYIVSVKAQITGEVYATNNSDQTFVTYDGSTWKEFSPGSRGVVVPPSGDALPISFVGDQSPWPYETPGKRYSGQFTGMNIFGGNDQLLCEIIQIKGDEHRFYYTAGHVICHQPDKEWVYPHTYFKASITADGNTLYGLKYDGSVESVVLKNGADTRILGSGNRLKNADVTQMIVSEPSQIYRDIVTGIFGRAYGLTTQVYPHTHTELLVFDHLITTDKYTYREPLAIKVGRDMKSLSFDMADFERVMCREGKDEKTKRYQINCSNDTQSAVFTAIDASTYHYVIIEAKKVLSEGTAYLNPADNQSDQE